MGLTVALLGVSIVARSVAGLVATLVLFLPIEVYRARLEDRALMERFGAPWLEYRRRTGFFWPRLPKS